MVPELIVLGLLLGWALGGKFLRIADAEIRHVWLVFIPIVIYFISSAVIHIPGMAKSAWIVGTAHLLGNVIILALVLLNLRLSGAKVIVAGMFMNLVTILANRGLMPADPRALTAAFGKHYLEQIKGMPLGHSSIMNGHCPLWFLCDIIPTHKPYALVPAVYSMGDMVMSIGIVIALISLMLAPSKVAKPVPKEA